MKLKTWNTEEEAMEYFQSHGWTMNSYHGGLGITFHRVGSKAVTIYQDGPLWRVAR